MTTTTTDRRSDFARITRAIALAGYAARLADLTSFRPGMIVAVSPRFGRHIAAGAPAEIAAIDLDHGHVGGVAEHSEACYDARRVTLSLVWRNAAGETVLSSRELAIHCYRLF